MNNKKKMVLGAAFVVAIMALAGIGYAAAVSYTGTTTNTSNNVDAEYIYLTLGDGTNTAYSNAITQDVAFDTVRNTDTTLTFTPKNIITVGGENVVELGAITVAVKSSAASKAFTLAINNTSGTMSTGNGTYYVSNDGSSVSAYTPGSAKTFTGLSTDTEGNATVPITLYWKPAASYSESSLPAAKLLENVTFTFTATAETAA